MNSIEDHVAMTDAILRFLGGADDNDTELTASAFTPDAVADLSALNDRPDVLEGREAILTRVLGHIGPMDTTHLVSNVRTHADGDTGTLTCYVLAQHFRPGEGRDPGSSGLTLSNRYRVTLARTEPGWRIAHLAVRQVWAQGDPAVMAG